MNNTETLNGLIGQTILKVEGLKKDSEYVSLYTDSKKYTFYHEQDCCEGVWLEDFEGEEEDLIGGVVTSASEETSSSMNEDTYESATWTFYKVDTNKGGLTMRWLGESNGYYSEEVNIKITPLIGLPCPMSYTE